VNWGSISAYLTWHWPDHHWHCNWRVVWTSSHMYAGKRRTVRATIITIFSHMTRDVSVFVKCDTMNQLCAVFLFKFELLLSQGSATTYWRHAGKCYISFVGNLVIFPAVKEFGKSAKNWQSYRHEFDVLFFGTQCIDLLQKFTNKYSHVA